MTRNPSPRGTGTLWRLAVLLLGLMPAPLLAQSPEEGPPPGAEPPSAPAGRQGWGGQLSLGAQLNLIQSDNLVGQTDVFTVLLGVNAAAGTTYTAGTHEVQGALRLNLAWARTPVAEALLKTNDVLLADGLYQGLHWGRSGPYAHVGLVTHLLPAEDARPFEAPYLITRRDGAVEPRLARGLRLSAGFSPLTLVQSAGWALRPVAAPALSGSGRLGAGARQTLVKEGTFVVADVDETFPVEVLEVDSVLQAGPVASTSVRGGLARGLLGYEAGAHMLWPLASSRAGALPARQQLRWVADARVDLALMPWLMLSYQHLTIYDRAFLDALQMQNNLLLRVQLQWQPQPR